MARTPLASSLQQIAADHRSTRRELLGAAGAATLTAAVWRPPAARAGAGDRVAIIGGGLAGLTCAYRLARSGVQADVFEASNRLGGRCWTIRGHFADGQVAEAGGELIDSGHLEIKQLAQELRLSLDNLLQAEPNGSEPLYHFDGRPYTYAEAAADYNAVYQKVHRDVSEASYPTTYEISTPRGRELDAMTIMEWIDESVPGGTSSRFGQLLDVAYNIEYGAECDQQSALNLLYLLGYSGQGRLRLFGPSNEKFHIQGGNDQLVTKMVARLDAKRVRTGMELRAIRRNGKAYDLTFANRTTLTYPRVVLALPFSILRRSVDYSAAGFSERKRWAITELGMGTNSKLNVGFRSRLWNDLGCNGDTFADTGYQATWEVSRAQRGASGILVDYTGGRIGAAFTGSPDDLTKRFLSQLEPVLPGITLAHDGREHLQHWTSHPWTLGSYSYYKPGQYTRFGAAEAEIEGAVHFAGEHTTQDYQGYLNGAVFSGNRVASEVLAEL